MTPERLAEIAARVEAATPGPWFRYRSLERHVETIQNPSGWLFVASDKGTRDDAELIAHAPIDLRELVEEVRRLREALESARDHIRHRTQQRHEEMRRVELDRFGVALLGQGYEEPLPASGERAQPEGGE